MAQIQNHAIYAIGVEILQDLANVFGRALEFSAYLCSGGVGVKRRQINHADAVRASIRFLALFNDFRARLLRFELDRLSRVRINDLVEFVGRHDLQLDLGTARPAYELDCLGQLHVDDVDKSAIPLSDSNDLVIGLE